MFQRNGADADRAVVVDDFGLGRMDGVEHDFVGHTFAEKIQLGCQQSLQFLVGIDVQGGSASQQSEGGNQSHQPETMVAMQMRDEDVVEAGELQLGTAELELCPFTAIHHEELLAYVHYL